MTVHHNHWDTSATRDETSRNISSSTTTTTTESPKVVRQLEMMNKNFVEMMRQIQTIKSIDTKCEYCGGPHSFTECPAAYGYTQKAAYAITSNHNLGGNAYHKCMSTRTTSSNLFSPLRDPESLIRRRNLGEPSSLFDFEEVMSIPHKNQGPPLAGPPPPNNNGPPPVVRPNGPAPRSMEELCQPSINGRGEPIAPIPIHATDFGLRHHMLQ
ncbi:hypothetical protein Tco_0184956 [Tanacetum coccineum]